MVRWLVRVLYMPGYAGTPRPAFAGVGRGKAWKVCGGCGEQDRPRIGSSPGVRDVRKFVQTNQMTLEPAWPSVLNTQRGTGPLL